jgi:hypothetical protein
MCNTIAGSKEHDWPAHNALSFFTVAAKLCCSQGNVEGTLSYAWALGLLSLLLVS